MFGISKIFSLPVLVASLSVLGLVTADYPINYGRCKEGNNDDLTGLPCTKYGYEATWVVTRKTEGKYSWLAVNDVFPPPPVAINKGERIRITLQNQLTDNEPVTLHFHGLLQQNGYTAMDGPTGLVQSGILPGQSFVYDFPVDQEGTYWIHSHAPGQYPQGLRTPLVVKGEEYTDYDQTVTVSDWWPDFAAAERAYAANQCANNVDGLKGLEMPHKKLIVNDIVPEWNSPATTSRTNSFVLPATKTLRLRIINMSSYAQLYGFFSDKRKIKITELDGVKVSPKKEMRGFTIASGQRMSLTVTDEGQTTPQNVNLYFLAEPRVSGNIGQDGCTIDNICCAAPTKDKTATQYTWFNIRTNANDTPRDPTAVSDFDGPTGKKDQFLLKNEKCTIAPNTGFLPDPGHPYFTDRLQVNQDYEQRDDVLDPTKNGCPTNNGQVDLYLPTGFRGYTESNFESADGTPMIWPDSYSDLYVHEIYMQDSKGKVDPKTKGRGVMSSTVYTKVPDSLFRSPESPANFYPQIPTMTTLEHVLDPSLTPDQLYSARQYYAADGSQLYENTFTLSPQNSGHWFVIRTTRGDHPLHLHGHEFQLLARIRSATAANGDSKNFKDDPIIDKGGASPEPYKRLKDAVTKAQVGISAPVRRDTLMIERGWTYVIAVRADNPGVWAMHCHNDFHSSTGMMMQVVELPNELRNRLGTYSFKAKSTDQRCPVTGFIKTYGTGVEGGGAQLPPDVKRRRTIAERREAQQSGELAERATPVRLPWQGINQLFTTSWKQWGWIPDRICWFPAPK